MQSKVIFISTHENHSLYFDFLDYGKIGHALILTISNGSLNVFSFDLFGRNLTALDETMTDNKVIFKPHIFNDLNGYDIKLMIHEQIPKIAYDKQSEKFTGKDVNLMETIAESLNASVSIGVVPNTSNAELYRTEFIKALILSKADIALNSFLRLTRNEGEILPPIFTYDESAFCALVPLPESKGFFEIAMRPYDKLTWILLIIAIGSCCMIILIHRCSKLSNSSPWRFLYVIFGFFLSQSPEIQEQSCRIKFLYKILIVGILILSSIYNSIITSSMIMGRDGEKYSTFDELFDDHKLNFTSTETFYLYIKETDVYQKIKNRLHIDNVIPTTIFEIKQQINSSILIRKCDLLENLMFQANFTFLANDYYILPEQMCKAPNFLYMSTKNPLRDTFQHLIDRIFTSGIIQHWTLLHAWSKGDKRYQKEDYENEHEVYYLKMEDLTEVFYILFGGWIIAVFALLIEIFWHDFLVVLWPSCWNNLKLKSEIIVK